jgi:ribosomal protein S11
MNTNPCEMMLLSLVNLYHQANSLEDLNRKLDTGQFAISRIEQVTPEKAEQETVLLVWLEKAPRKTRYRVEKLLVSLSDESQSATHAINQYLAAGWEVVSQLDATPKAHTATRLLLFVLQEPVQL